MSLRFKTSKRGLGEVPMPSTRRLRGRVSAEGHIRERSRIRERVKVTKIREAQNIENGRFELPFELLNNQTGEVIKKHHMTDSEAVRKNSSIRDLGFAWRRCGY